MAVIAPVQCAPQNLTPVLENKISGSRVMESASQVSQIAQPSSASNAPADHSTREDVSGLSGFLYLNQAAVLRAGVLDMLRAVEVVGEGLALYDTGQCRPPPKVVLR